MKSQFKTGNVVKLASGGPKMTVVGTSNETDEVVVQYFNDKAEMQVSTVNPEALNSLDEVAYDGKKYYVQRFANLSEYREEPGFYELKVKCGQSGFGFLAGILGEWAAKTADLSVGSTVKTEGEWIIATAYKSSLNYVMSSLVSGRTVAEQVRDYLELNNVQDDTVLAVRVSNPKWSPSSQSPEVYITPGIGSVDVDVFDLKLAASVANVDLKTTVGEFLKS